MIQRELTRPPADLGRSPFQRSLQRRRRMLAALLITAVVALIGALVTSGAMFWVVHVLALAALVAYVGVLLHVRNASADDEMTHLVSGR